mmetsp:Transcript_11911/g.18409  ORF Transcript_11911/g.18409 Transcript_11911/m.18409 type:complete len:401 (+) Transcript_11911:141-1343(+)|eukprot:CAMPEP_0195287574 /NCGR_PEP_ID=MMETSP0707-20130614/4581_1 /TAXON_ID=33640 /ORGANISM="Asterionellopsis glacialis, Strain CCMP134" /LENGTH=400 /DNA_ID=CAMNT_0040347341 /DNA_START=77 /DNA_END=1279 /DNA_ORIENTATION=+
MWETPSISKLQEALLNSHTPIGMRMRAAYYLRQYYDMATKNDNNPSAVQQQVIDLLAQGLAEKSHGSLLRHEFAYVMGQLRDKRCCPPLEHILASSTDCIMVRHEAAEALGAIGSSTSKKVLRDTQQANVDTPELADTCLLALNFIEWKEQQQPQPQPQQDQDEKTNESPQHDPHDAPPACACMLNPYSSVDPAPPHPSHVSKTSQEIGDILANPALPMFERYRAMFSLRNRGGSEAVEQLCMVLTQDTSSALLRHEVAYVLGQMQHPESIEALSESLRRPEEHEMVRHESAEALGAMDGGKWMTHVEPILQEFSNDSNIVVRESCMVALDAADYWGHSNSNEHGEEEKDNTSTSDDDETTTNDNEGSFVQQKSLTNGPNTSTTTKSNNGILINHFNVQV